MTIQIQAPETTQIFFYRCYFGMRSLKQQKNNVGLGERIMSMHGYANQGLPKMIDDRPAGLPSLPVSRPASRPSSSRPA